MLNKSNATLARQEATLDSLGFTSASASASTSTKVAKHCVI